jgi:DNA-binding transcriptional ArsR family regulator
MTTAARRDVFQAIADPTRRQIIDLLGQESMTLNTIAEKFDISRPAISQHIKILAECGIIEIEQKGRERYCRIQARNLIPAFMWMDQFRRQWDEKLDAFENYLATLQNANLKPKSK